MTFYYWAYHLAVALTRLLGKTVWWVSGGRSSQERGQPNEVASSSSLLVVRFRTNGGHTIVCAKAGVDLAHISTKAIVFQRLSEKSASGR